MRSTILRIPLCVLSIRSTDRLICFKINPGAKRFIGQLSECLPRQRQVEEFIQGREDPFLSSTSYWFGRVNWKIAPYDAGLVHNLPPWDSMMERLIDNPIPIPCGLV